jgi:hypothetical protein
MPCACNAHLGLPRWDTRHYVVPTRLPGRDIGIFPLIVNFIGTYASQLGLPRWDLPCKGPETCGSTLVVEIDHFNGDA